MADELTHDEVWDDSEQLDSWNGAFEEYKKYHSLALKGEKVQPSVPKQPVPSKNTPNGTSKTESTLNAPVNFIGPAQPPPTTSTSKAPVPPTLPLPLPSAITQPSSAPPALATLPQALLASSDDEALKNIMMSWYYAGYYTGLYEGQQQAWASMQQQQEDS